MIILPFISSFANVNAKRDSRFDRRIQSENSNLLSHFTFSLQENNKCSGVSSFSWDLLFNELAFDLSLS